MLRPILDLFPTIDRASPAVRNIAGSSLFCRMGRVRFDHDQAYKDDDESKQRCQEALQFQPRLLGMTLSKEQRKPRARLGRLNESRASGRSYGVPFSAVCIFCITHVAGKNVALPIRD